MYCFSVYNANNSSVFFDISVIKFHIIVKNKANRLYFYSKGQNLSTIELGDLRFANSES
jgi:hypothetical protein